ncbi:MAG: hypothetical protein H6518_07435 [Microthrixaceae bacterium]|nr:hypothetical protein [Microthrixaceae bacterium]
MIIGITQIAGFVEPPLAGLVIASQASSTTGVGLAFGVDAATFAVSAATFA